MATLEEPTLIVLRGGMPFGLFTGERTYTLRPDRAETGFKMREEYCGPVAKLIFRSIPDLGPSFRQFAQGLNAQAERG